MSTYYYAAAGDASAGRGAERHRLAALAGTRTATKSSSGLGRFRVGVAPTTVHAHGGYPGPRFTLFAVEPVGPVTPAPGTDGHAGFVDQVRVLREVPAHTAYGPNGAAVLALIGQVDELTFPEIYALGEVYEKVNHEGDTGSTAEDDDTDSLPGTLGAAYNAVDVFCSMGMDPLDIRYAYPAHYAEERCADFVRQAAAAAWWYREGQHGVQRDGEAAKYINWVWKSDHFTSRHTGSVWCAVRDALHAEIAKNELGDTDYELLTRAWRLRGGSLGDEDGMRAHAD